MDDFCHLFEWYDIKSVVWVFSQVLKTLQIDLKSDWEQYVHSNNHLNCVKYGRRWVASALAVIFYVSQFLRRRLFNLDFPKVDADILVRAAIYLAQEPASGSEQIEVIPWTIVCSDYIQEQLDIALFVVAVVEVQSLDLQK